MNHILLIRYLTGESADHEQHRVEQWLEAKPEHHKLLKELELIWKASGKTLEVFENNFDAEEDWKSLRYRIEKERGIREAKVQPARVYRHSWSGKSSGFAQVIRVAAVLLISAVAGVYTWQNFHINDPGQEEPVMREIVMDKGQRANFVLSNATNVNLNADSRIRPLKRYA